MYLCLFSLKYRQVDFFKWTLRYNFAKFRIIPDICKCYLDEYFVHVVLVVFFLTGISFP